MLLRDNKTMQETRPGQLASKSDLSTFKGNTLVKAVSGTARNLLNTFRRSFSSSTSERMEDASYLTIQFLYMRLQAERTVNKAEKQRVQQLTRKVVELEQQLNLEIARRKEAESNNVLVSSKYDSCYLKNGDSPYCNTRSHTMNKECKEKASNIGSSFVESNSCCVMEQHAGSISGTKNQMVGGAAYHADRSEVYESFLCYRSECLKSSYKGSGDSEPCLEEVKENIVPEMTQGKLKTRDDKYGAGSQHAFHKIDVRELEESDEYKVTFSNFQEMSGSSHRSPNDSPALHFQQHAVKEISECSSLGSASNVASAGTSRQRQSPARAISSPRDYHERALEGIMSSPRKLSFGALTDSSISQWSRQEHSRYNLSQALQFADECSLHEYITADLESSKEIEEDTRMTTQKRKQVATHPPYLLERVCAHEKCLYNTQPTIY